MSEQDNVAVAETAAETPANGQTDTTETTETVDWKAQSRKWEGRAKANAEAAAKLAKIEEAAKSETERLTDRATRAEAALAAAQLDTQRLRVVAAKQLPADYAEFLTADTAEGMEAQADKLLAGMSTPAGPRPDPTQGPRSDAMPLNGDPILESLKRNLGI